MSEHKAREMMKRNVAESEVGDLKIKAKKKRGNEFEKWHIVCSIYEIKSRQVYVRRRIEAAKVFDFNEMFEVGGTSFSLCQNQPQSASILQ